MDDNDHVCTECCQLCLQLQCNNCRDYTIVWRGDNPTQQFILKSRNRIRSHFRNDECSLKCIKALMCSCFNRMKSSLVSLVVHAPQERKFDQFIRKINGWIKPAQNNGLECRGHRAWDGRMLMLIKVTMHINHKWGVSTSAFYDITGENNKLYRVPHEWKCKALEFYGTCCEQLHVSVSNLLGPLFCDMKGSERTIGIYSISNGKSCKLLISDLSEWREKSRDGGEI